MNTPGKTSSPGERRVNFKKIFAYGIPICICICIIALSVLFRIIYPPVEAVCREAMSENDGDCIEALIAYIESDHHTYKEKNHAIRAIGQLSVKRAVPVLEKLYTEQPCEKPCRTDRYICKYELEKAIKFSKGTPLFSPLTRALLLD